MTFYELEKKCKNKKLLRIFFILFIILIIVFLGVFYFLHYQKPQKRVLKTIKVEKTKKNIKNINKKIKNTHKIKQKEITLLPSIDLNITQDNILKNKIKKNIKKIEINQTTKHKKELKKEVILKTINLPSYKTCISIASKYLNKKDYKNALQWAKYANIQNKKDPESWVITAKALYSLGKKDAAIKLLKIYNSYYNNKKIQNLIKEMGEK